MLMLVTGATGLVGNNVVRLLLERGHKVRVLTRTTSDSRPLQDLDVEIVHGDVRNPNEVVQACTGVSFVIHAAAWVHIGWTGNDLAHAVNVRGTHNIAEAARQTGARMVHVSSVDAVGIRSHSVPATEDDPAGGKPLCPYVVTKTGAEQIIMDQVAQGLQAVIVNPGFMFGPWDWKPSSGRMLLTVATRWTPVTPTGGCSVCDVRDVAAGILAAAEHGQIGRRYILAGFNLSYFRLWKLIAQITNGRLPWFPAGPLMRLAGARWGDLQGKLTGREPDVNSASVKMSNLFHYYSSARAQAELGYQNRALEDSIRDAWDWFRQNGYVKK